MLFPPILQIFSTLEIFQKFKTHNILPSITTIHTSSRKKKKWLCGLWLWFWVFLLGLVLRESYLGLEAENFELEPDISDLKSSVLFSKTCLERTG